jgi:hypothetical protein
VPKAETFTSTTSPTIFNPFVMKTTTKRLFQSRTCRGWCPALGASDDLTAADGYFRLPPASSVVVDGTFTFHNPYGYLPASVFGLLPFEMLLTIAYLAVAATFGALLARYRQQCLRLHFYCLAVVIVGFVETSLLFWSQFSANTTGHLDVYVPLVGVALVLQNIRLLGIRVLLILICMGYEVIRPKLLEREKASIICLSCVYFVAGMVASIAVSVYTSDVSTDDEGANIRGSESLARTLVISVLLTNVCSLAFLAAIYVALTRTREGLLKSKQIQKLSMFNRLAYSLKRLLALWCGVQIFALFGRNTITWEWKWVLPYTNIGPTTDLAEWVVLASLCYIWRPSATSSQHANSLQLPDDEDDAADADATESDSGVELVMPAITKHV